jgi:hypothetical protein
MDQYYIEPMDIPKTKKRPSKPPKCDPVRKKLVIVGNCASGKRTLLGYLLGVSC